MSTDNDWVESCVAAAVEAVAEHGRVFPEALLSEFQALLSDDLQHPRKPGDLEAIALRLGAANRPPA